MFSVTKVLLHCTIPAFSDCYTSQLNYWICMLHEGKHCTVQGDLQNWSWCITPQNLFLPRHSDWSLIFNSVVRSKVPLQILRFIILRKEVVLINFLLVIVFVPFWDIFFIILIILLGLITPVFVVVIVVVRISSLRASIWFGPENRSTVLLFKIYLLIS